MSLQNLTMSYQTSTMLYTEPAAFEDEILTLARDPNLNKEKGKSEKLVLLIQGFPLAERKVSRLCQLSLTILQTLEKIELNLRNWAFMSLDINSSNHFLSLNPDEIKIFNNNVSVRVISSCQDLTVKLNKITADLDFITKALRTLTPIEYISDSGTLLTSLTLRNIKLKDELRDKISVAYLKAKLITIGTNLEDMLEGGTAEQQSTVSSYKQFVVSLLGQLNRAVDAQEDEEKNECLAVINDMEQMFEAFKLEYAQSAVEQYEPLLDEYYDDSPRDLDSLDGLGDTQLTSPSLFLQPTVHSITKTPELSLVETHRRNSVVSLASTSMLQKSTLTEELPYLMSAFNLAKTLEEDVFHYKNDEEEKHKKLLPTSEQPPETAKRQFPAHKTNLPDLALYSQSSILSAVPQSDPSAYLYANNSLLSKFGIKPQVITAPLGNSARLGPGFKRVPAKALGEATEDEEKENGFAPLTRANLDSYTLSAFKTLEYEDTVE